MFGHHLLPMISIDPGTNCLGIAISMLDVTTGKMTLEEAYTVDIKTVAKLYASHIEAYYGDRAAKLYAVEYLMFNLVRAWQPAIVASEGPYLGKFPQAYAALVECLSAIQRGCRNYSQSLPVKVFDPATVKKSLGVPGNSGDKALIANAIANTPRIDTSNVNLFILDEHSTDAIAVGHACLLTLAR